MCYLWSVPLEQFSQISECLAAPDGTARYVEATHRIDSVIGNAVLSHAVAMTLEHGQFRRDAPIFAASVLVKIVRDQNFHSGEFSDRGCRETECPMQQDEDSF
jgi:hypothetical protein